MGEFDSTTPMFESILNEYIIEKVGTFYLDEAKYDKNIKATWFIKSKNGANNCCVSVAGYNKPLRGRSMMIVLKKEGDEWLTMIKRKANGDHEFPGGGWDEGETVKDAAVRELHEEAQVNVKDVKRIGTSIQFSDKDKDVAMWVKLHVKKEDWWYGYYSAVFIGLYDGEFTGKISKEDIEHTFSWQPISKIKSKISKDLYDAVVEYTEQNKDYKESADAIDEFDEAVSVQGKKFTKAYRASLDYRTGHLLKITYSLEGCEVTNVGYAKALREVVGEVAEDSIRAKHRGSTNTRFIRSYLCILKGIIFGAKRLEQRKKFITNYLNKHIGDVGFLDFQAKDCKIIDIWDMYEKKHIADDVETVGIFAARFTPTSTRMIVSKEDMKKVRERVHAPGSKFKVSKIRVGDTERHPLFMSTYWNDKDDHQILDIDGKPIQNDIEDRKVENKLDSIQAIIGDLEVKGYHIDDKYVKDFLDRYRNRKIGNEEVDTFKESVYDFMYEEAIEMMFEDAVGSNDSNSDNRKEQIEAVINIAKDVLKEFKEKYPDSISHGIEASTTKEQKDEFCEWSDSCQIMSGDITKFDNFNDNDSNKEINEKCWSIVDEITNELSKRVKEDSSLTGKISGDGDKLDFYICYELKFNETPVKESADFNTKLSKKDVLRILKEDFKYDKKEFVLIYKAPLVLMGVMKECNDIDVTISRKLAKQLEKDGYKKTKSKLGSDRYEINDRLECFVHDDLGGFEVVNGYQCKTLDEIYKEYKRRNRPKDQETMKCIEAYKKKKGTPMTESVMYEDVGDADDNRPKSDHPVKDLFMDIDRATVKNQQKAKRTVQNIQNAGRAAMKPINRAKDWIGNMIADWKDADENNIKEKMADPHARNNLFSAIRKAITGMALFRAGVLLNPMFIFLAVTKGIGKDKKEFRLRNEMIGEIKTEIEIVEKKIAEAEADHDMDKMAKLMRFKNELNKKLLRVGGSPQWKKII